MASHTEIVNSFPAYPAVERRMRALHMRERGMTYKGVGLVLGVSATRAQQLVRRALRECTAGYRYQHKELSLSDAKQLLPLLGFLKGVADERT